MNDAEKILDQLDARDLGRKLQLARKKRGMTQAEAANIISAGRTTLVAIEKGDRRIRPSELLKLTIAYGRDISIFVEETRIETLFAEPQFRGPKRLESKSDSTIDLWIEELRSLSYNYYELEQSLDAPLVKRYPREYQLGMLRADELGEKIALEERQRLGIGDGPIPELRTLLAQDVGLRIYRLPIEPSTYSAIYLYSDQIGGCIAINGNHPAARTRFSLAHEYGHFLTSRFKHNVYANYGYPGRSKTELVADQFAVHFLMPASGVARRFKDIRNLKRKFTPYDLVDMAHYFGVSVEALSHRLEGLKLIPTGLLDYLRKQGFKVLDVQRQLGQEQLPASGQRLPVRHQLLALQALQQELVGVSEIADLLEVELVQVRAMFTTLYDQTFKTE